MVYLISKIFVFLLLLQYCLQDNNIQFLCGENPEIYKCVCEQETDSFDHVPLFNIDCRRLNYSSMPSGDKLPYLMGHLDISHNNIVFLNVSTKLSSTTLYTLDLSYNKIKYIEDNFFVNLTKVRTLNMEYNNIQNIHDKIFRGLVNLQTLNLRMNKLKTIPAATFKKLPELKTIILSYNDLGMSFQNFQLKNIMSESVTDLYLDHINISNINMNIFASMLDIKKLSITHNPVKELPYLALSNLEYLDISGVLITNLTAKSLSFPYLKILRMNHLPNLMKINEHAFYNLHNIEEISIQYCNNLQTIDPLVFGYLNEKNSSQHLTLKRFYLNDNGLKFLPDVFIFIFEDLEEVDLAGNLWHCDCKNNWFKLLNKNVKDFQKVKCSSPLLLANKTIVSLKNLDFQCMEPKVLKSKSLIQIKSWLFPLIGCLSIIVAILVGILICFGPYEKKYHSRMKSVGPDSPYSPVTINPNEAEYVDTSAIEK